MQRQLGALMASKSGMTKKQRSPDSLKKTQSPCGTMMYIAESRGTLQRADSSWRPRPPYDSISRITRKNPAEK
jgi:hypothetical protein